MKKRILMLLPLSLLLILALFSCKIGGDGGDNGGAGGSTDGVTDMPAEGLIYSGDITLQIVMNGEAFDDVLFDSLRQELNLRTHSTPAPVKDDSPVADHELVIGPSNREVSRIAYDRLARIRLELEDEEIGNPRYVICSDGSSVAIAYDEHAEGIGQIFALRLFTEKYLREELRLRPGTHDKGVASVLDYYRECDEKRAKEQWDALEFVAGKEITEALHVYYDAIYSDELITWFASLYDPVEGGYYYSNSGRDTQGFLPDIESTYQALTFIRSSGMIEKNSDLPEWMKEDIIRFVKSRQDPNGFFYHPQWTKEQTDSLLSRRARDLNWATAILSSLGAKPTYKTPGGADGDGIIYDRYEGAVAKSIVSPLKHSSVDAVSAVIAANTETAVPDHLVSDVTLKAYLATKDLSKNSYPIGNEIAAQASQIIARDAVLQSQGKNYSLVKIICDWFLEHQNPETGHWHAAGTDYGAVNGLFKIMAFYEAAKVQFPNAKNAALSAISCMVSDTPVHHVCDIYNTWYTVDMITKNIRAYGSADEAKEITRAVREVAVGAIKVTLDKLLEFRKTDGSFSYYRDTSAATSQGMIVAVGNSNEGDVNATEICTEGTVGHIFGAMGFSNYAIKSCGKVDWYRYLSILEDLAAVEKNELVTEVDPLTFEEERLDEAPSAESGAKYTINSTGGYVAVVNDPLNSGRGQVLKLVSTKGQKGDSVLFPAMNVHPTASCYVFDADLAITEGNSGYTIQLVLGSRSYMMAFKLTDEKIMLWDSSSQNSTKVERNLSAEVNRNEWFNLRVEYYFGDHYTVRAKIYVNGEIVAVSDNYYDGKGTKLNGGVGTPDKWTNTVELLVMSSYANTVLFDNVKSYRTSDVYEPVTDRDLPLNADPINRGDLVYGFEELEVGKNYPDRFLVKEGDKGDSVEVKEIEGGKALGVKAVGSGSSLTIPANYREPLALTDVFEADVKFLSATGGSRLRISLHDYPSTSGYMTGFDLVVVNEGAEQFVTVCEAGNKTNGAALLGIKLPIKDGFKIRLEFYEVERITIVYINGVMMATSTSVYKDIGYYTFGKAMLSVQGDKAFEVLLDNIICEKRILSFEDAVTPDIDSTVHGFNKIPEGGTLDGAKIIRGALVFGGKGNTAAIPKNQRSDIYTVDLLEFTAITKGASGEYRIALTDSEGNIAFAFDTVIKDGVITLYEATASGRLGRLCSFDAGEDTVLRFERFVRLGEVHIYLDGEIAAKSGMAWTPESEGLESSDIVISQLTEGTLSLDNLKFESYNKIYKPVTAPDGENDEDGAEVITYESSTSGNLPAAITTRLATGGASVRIAQALRNGALSNVAVFTTKPGGNDEFNVYLTKAEENATAYVFETDLWIDFSVGGYAEDYFQIFFTNADNTNKNAYFMDLHGKSTKSIYFKDYSSKSSPRKDSSEYNLGIKEGEWWNIRVEYYFGDRSNTFIKTYVNGELFYNSVNFYGSQDEAALPVTEIDMLRIYTYGGADAVMKLDNTSFSLLNLECKDDAVGRPGSGGSTGGDNTGGEGGGNEGTDTPDQTVGNVGTENLPENITVKDSNENLYIEDAEGDLKFTSDGGDYVYFYPTYTEDNYTAASFEMDISFEFPKHDTPSSKYYYYELDINDKDLKTAFRLYIYLDETKGEIVFNSRNSEGSTGSTLRSPAKVSLDFFTYRTKTLRVRVDYLISGEDVIIKVYLDGALKYTVDSTLTGETYGENPTSHKQFYTYKNDGSGKPLTTVGLVRFFTSTGKSTSFYIENVSLRLTAEAPAEPEIFTPEEPELPELPAIVPEAGKYFEAMDGLNWELNDIWSTIDGGNSGVASPRLKRGDSSTRYISGELSDQYTYIYIKTVDAVGKVLAYGQPLAAENEGDNSNLKGEGRVYLHNIQEGGNAYVFETEINISKVNGVKSLDNPWVMQIGFNSDGTDKSSFFGNAFIYDNGNGTYSLGYNSYNLYGEPMEGGRWYTVTVEYFPALDLVRYYINGEKVGERVFVATQDTSTLAFTALIMREEAYDTEILLDNTFAGSVELEVEYEKPLATVLPVKGGAKGIAVLMHDDGDLATMSILDRIYGRYSLRADVALVADRVYTLATGAARAEEVEKWNVYFDTERWSLVSHSATHTFWGSVTDEVLSVNGELVEREVKTSADILRELFPGRRTLTFAYPGFDSYTSLYGKMTCYGPAIEYAKEVYIAARDCRFAKAARQTVSYHDLVYSLIPASSISYGEDNLNKNLAAIEEAATYGKLAVLFSHKVYEDGSSDGNTSSVPASYIEAIASKVAGYVESGLLWNAHFEEAALYLREVESAEVSAVKTGEGISLTLTDKLDNSVYNYPLTVRVRVDEGCEAVKITQGERISYAIAKEIDGEWVVDADIVPDGGEAALTAISKADIPEDEKPEEPEEPVEPDPNPDPNPDPEPDPEPDTPVDGEEFDWTETDKNGWS